MGIFDRKTEVLEITLDPLLARVLVHAAMNGTKVAGTTGRYEAIKYARQRCAGLGLRGAKDFIDSLVEMPDRVLTGSKDIRLFVEV